MKTADRPLQDFEVFRTPDLDEARRQIGRLLAPHRLHPVRRSANFDVRCHAVSLGGASVLYAHYGAAVRLEPGSLESFYLVGMPLVGASTIQCGGDEVVSRPGLASVQSCTRPVVTHWSERCAKLSVKIERAALERRLEALLGRPPRQPVEFAARLDLKAGPGASWQRLVAFLLAELSPASVYLSCAAPQRALEDALISTLLFVQPHTYSEALREPAPPPAPAFMRRAEELIAEDPSVPGGVGELARRVGVGLRSLQSGFRRYRDTTPVAFIRALRLARAHEALCRADARTRVTDVAMGVGYTHFGRFAADYRARYGEAPSSTIARARDFPG